MKTQLLLTFTTTDSLQSAIEMILSYYTLPEERIFCLCNAKDPNELFLTYNISKVNFFDTPKQTLLVHRKKHTNTLYTINAVNEISIQETGYINTKHQINWNNYRNSLLLTNNNELQIYRTKLVEIIDI